jgi:hypothetical protein
MPRIETEGAHARDSIHVQSIMLWPDEAHAARRAQFVAVTYARQLRRDAIVDEELTLPGRLVDALIDAPSWAATLEEARELTRRATIAGDVFMVMYIMDRWKDRLPKRGASGASLSKAIFAIATWARNATYGDGVSLVASEKSVKDCWRDYRDVAHLWGARAMNRAFAGADDVFTAWQLPQLLEAAAYLQLFATTFSLDSKSAREPETLLSPDTAWTLDVSQHRPRLITPTDPAVFDDAPFMGALRQYATAKPKK